MTERGSTSSSPFIHNNIVQNSHSQRPQELYMIYLNLHLFDHFCSRKKRVHHLPHMCQVGGIYPSQSRLGSSGDESFHKRSRLGCGEPTTLFPSPPYTLPPLAVLHSTNSCQVTVHALLWYLLNLTLLLISSVIRPDHPALWIALSTASILSHP